MVVVDDMIKLAFSTLGCPNWSWNDIFATAKDLGMAGIEIRGIEKEMYAPRMKIFSPENRDKTMERVRLAGLEIPILTSGAVLGDPERRAEALREAADYTALAAALGVPYVRVLASLPPQPVEADLGQARELYLELCSQAKEKGITLLIETNGVLGDTAVMKKFMQGTDPDCSGVLWDLHHPHRYFGESAEQSWENIGEYVRHVHVKDSAMKNGQLQYRMMGYGDVPVFDAMRLLSGSGYNGFVSLEWTKRWNEDLEEPGIVFYHYHNYMLYLLEQL